MSKRCREKRGSRFVLPLLGSNQESPRTGAGACLPPLQGKETSAAEHRKVVRERVREGLLCLRIGAQLLRLAAQLGGFRALGEPELGALLICETDHDIIAASGGEVSLRRDQTLMQGAPSCTFRYRFAPRS